MLHLILILVALIFFAMATFGIGRFNLVAAGLFCWLLATTGWLNA